MYDVMVDEVGKVDFKRSKGASIPKLQKRFKHILQSDSRRRRNSRFTERELKEMLRTNNFPMDKHDTLIQFANQNGTLLMKNGGTEYEFTLADFGSPR